MTETLLDRALAALLAHKDDKGMGALLVQRDPSLVWLATEADGARIAVWAPPAGSTEDAAADFRQIVKRHNGEGAPIFYVIAGGARGSEGARDIVKSAKPTLEVSPLGFYHLDPSGQLTMIARRSEFVEEALERIADAPDLDEEMLAAAAARTRAVAEKQAAIAGKLQGKYGVTAAISIVCVALFLLRFVWSDGGTSDHLLRMGANYGPTVKAGEWHRLLASAFLHADIIHLVANTVALWAFGPVLEAMLGARRYLTLYGASALAGAVASAFLTDPRVSVGASGAVWGLMTAGIAVVYRPNGLLPESMLAAARKRAWAPLALNLMYSIRPGVDFLAHAGGGIVGAALILSGVLTAGVPPLDAAAGPASRRAARRESPVWTGLAALFGLAMIASIAMGFVSGKPWESGAPPVMKRTAIGDTGVSLELPEAVAKDLKVEQTDAGAGYLFGKAGSAPFLFEVEVHKLDETIPTEQIEVELEALRNTLVEKPTPDTKPVSAPVLTNVGRHRTVVVEVKLKSDVPVKTIFVCTTTRIVIVRAYGIGERPKSWNGIEEKIVSSMQE